jgi:hypothetical protein
MNRLVNSKLGLILGACGLILMAGTASAAAAVVPELDPGSAGSGIALAIGAALLIVERYRSRR